jgi:DNA-binding NtrC family response regulator
MANAAPKLPRILVVDDGTEYARVVQERLPEFRLVTNEGEPSLRDGPAALQFLSKHHASVDVVLLDMHFDVPEERLLPLGAESNPRRVRRFQGVAILREIRRRFPHLPVVLLTAEEDLSLVDMDGELAAQSMTYVLDGEDLDTLRIRINAALQEAAQGLEEEDLLWGGNRGMQAVRRRLSVLARGGMPVILEGETGTGKSYLAERFIHKNSGRRGAFVTLDVSTVPQDLMAAHLFGALRGSFTGAVMDRKGVFELAHGGTLFLDEVQNMPLDIQKQLLVVLQERRIRPLGAAREQDVDVKVIAASNQPLLEAVRAGRFRQDLYMRLGPATRVTIPSLRERQGDVMFFARRMVQRAGDDPDNLPLKQQVSRAAGQASDAPLTLVVGRQETGRAAVGGLQLVIPDPAWKLMAGHSWPGNMRELNFVMHNLVTFTLVAAADALRSGMSVSSPRLQVDTGLVGEMLQASAGLRQPGATGSTVQGTTTAPGGATVHNLPASVVSGPPRAADQTSLPENQALQKDRFVVEVRPQKTLNGVAVDVERQYFHALYRRMNGEFGRMAEVLLGDASKERAIRLRFNQIGLKVRELRGR